MTRYLTLPDRETSSVPHVDEREPAELIPAAVSEVLEMAETWLRWDGRPVASDGNTWTPHKALRRVTDHLIDHLAELECRLAGLPTIPDQWHGRMLTLDSDWARFTEADLDEAVSRLERLAACYRAHIAGLDDKTLDDQPSQGWTLRQVIFHVAGVTTYAHFMDD